MHFLLNTEWREKLLHRFIKYTQFYSTSEAGIEQIPSTERQWNIAKYLFEELKSIGLSDVSLNENCYIMATLPSNISDKKPIVGFISHFDTSPDFSGENVKAKVWENYSGEDLVLNENGFTLKNSDFPELKQYKGQTLITTDGTSLLGADDKAGIAEIVTAMEFLLAHPDIKHGEIKIGFTPDEEVGRGAELFDIKKFGADFAYTMDGGEIGELEFENFNAAEATLVFEGLSVHPGMAKNKMINAALLASEFSQLLPQNETPATTDNYEGFFHLTHIEGDVSNASLHYIIRDHSEEIFNKRKEKMLFLVKYFNEKYKKEVCKILIKDQYFNMKKHIEDKMYIIDFAKNAFSKSGIEPNIKAIRGGTDGAMLSYKGLPCPNIFAGGHNFHGPYEYVPLESMMKATEVIIHLCEEIAL